MSQLRAVSAYAQTAGASLLAYGCNLANLDGTLFSGTAPLYFQIHDKVSAPTATNVPRKSFLIATSGPFPLASIFQDLGPINFVNGLAVGISSTHGTYTAATATYDVFGDVEEGDQQVAAVTGLTTETATNDVILAIWPSASGPVKLFSIMIVNGEGVVIYPMLFNNDSPVNGNTPNRRLASIAIGATKSYYFGPDGLYDQTFFGANKGCTLVLSTTAQTLTAATTSLSTLTGTHKV